MHVVPALGQIATELAAHDAAAAVCRIDCNTNIHC